jgi:hypothetical protein
LQALVCEQANHSCALGGEYGPRRWKVNSGAVLFYFELARLSTASSKFSRLEGPHNLEGESSDSVAEV